MALPLREGYDDMAAKTRTACERAGLEPLTSAAPRGSNLDSLAGGAGISLANGGDPGISRLSGLAGARGLGPTPGA